MISLLILSTLVSVVYCGSKGAPASSCSKLKGPNYLAGTYMCSDPPSDNDKWFIKVSTTVTAGTEIPISVGGKGFKGLLVAVSEGSLKVKSNGGADLYKAGPCEESSITHTSAVVKDQVDLVWTVPKDKTSAEISGIVVGSRDNGCSYGGYTETVTIKPSTAITCEPPICPAVELMCAAKGMIEVRPKDEKGCLLCPKCQAVVCPADVKECSDGSFVNRAAPKCEFPLCPGEKKECLAMACPDFTPDCEAMGKVLGIPKDEHGCDLCPDCLESKACPEDAKVCPDGSSVSRQGPNCEFAKCPGETKCAPRDCPAFIPDCKSMGKVLGTPKDENGCDLCPTCLDATPCPEDAKMCPDGSSVSRQGPDCEFAKCPGETKCEPLLCPDYTPDCESMGKILGSAKDENGCELCPGCVDVKACTEEAKVCPDGSSVSRQGPDCEFAKCPDDCGDGCVTAPDGTSSTKNQVGMMLVVAFALNLIF